ncbi:MAG: MIP/aquaporin family protein [Fuerstiella sp.]
MASEFKGVQQMSPYLAEFIGTMILVLLGDGVCANVKLNKTFGHDTGWLVITTGWAMAVTFAVYLTSVHSGAHLNPAVTVGLAAIGEFEMGQVGGYVLAQLGGGILGAILVWLTYLPHWKETKDSDAIRGCFCNTPAIANVPANLMAEIIGTFVLVLGIVAILRPDNMIPNTGFTEGFQPCVVGMMVWAVGLSLGGSTGYAINPARDLGPRIAHAVLPIANKGASGWSYSWIPVVGPLIGGIIATLIYRTLWAAPVVLN